MADYFFFRGPRIYQFKLGHTGMCDEVTFDIKECHLLRNIRSRSGQRSKSSLFALSAAETGLITAANQNFAKGLPKG